MFLQAVHSLVREALESSHALLIGRVVEYASTAAPEDVLPALRLLAQSFSSASRTDLIVALFLLKSLLFSCLLLLFKQHVLHTGTDGLVRDPGVVTTESAWLRSRRERVAARSPVQESWRTTQGSRLW